MAVIAINGNDRWPNVGAEFPRAPSPTGQRSRLNPDRDGAPTVAMTIARRAVTPITLRACVPSAGRAGPTVPDGCVPTLSSAVDPVLQYR